MKWKISDLSHIVAMEDMRWKATTMMAKTTQIQNQVGLKISDVTVLHMHHHRIKTMPKLMSLKKLSSRKENQPMDQFPRAGVSMILNYRGKKG